MDILIEAFKEIKPILDKYAIDYWLEAGTLLGMVRAGAILVNDKDIDLGAYYEQVVEEIPKIGKELYTKGYDVMVNDSKLSFIKGKARVTIHLFKCMDNAYTKSLVFGYKHKTVGDALNYLLIDGLTSPYHDFFHHSRKKTLISFFKKLMLHLPLKLKMNLSNLLICFGVRIKLFKSYCLLYPRKFYDDFRPSHFYGEYVNIPLYAEEYLEYCYGDTWRDPSVRKTFPKGGYYMIVQENSNKLYKELLGVENEEGEHCFFGTMSPPNHQPHSPSSPTNPKGGE
jgi:hypothetical protein